MTAFGQDTEAFVAELDAAIEAHLSWTRKVLRCAVSRASPGDDVLAPDAHLRCYFGHWFAQHRDAFDQLDPDLTAHALLHHERMHAAVRSLCADLLADLRGEPADLDAFEAAQSALIADLAQLKIKVLAHSARKDPLTGLLLRYGLEDEYARFCAQGTRNRQLPVLLLADVDHFKQVNDAHGHAVGDQALRHVADVLRNQARAGEPVFRFGGEEFLILMHAADKTSAGQAADRLLQALRDTPMPMPNGAELCLRFSAGLAVASPKEPMAQVVERADRALYAAKRAGRDRWLWGVDA